MENHYLPRAFLWDGARPRGAISPGKNSCLLYWSKNPSGRAIVFVHGFGGHCTGTWNQFPRLLSKDGTFANVDFLFYGYDGIRGKCELLSADLYRCIRLLSQDPRPFQQATRLSPRKEHKRPRLDEITLVAHSLGAVVARKALLNAFRQEDEWKERVRLILYAPAHRGARAARLLSSAFRLFRLPDSFDGAVKYFLPLLEELDPSGEAIPSLVQDTEVILAEEPVCCLQAARVVFGSDELVVKTDRFCADPIPENIHGRGHQSICKPRDLNDPPYPLISLQP